MYVFEFDVFIQFIFYIIFVIEFLVAKMLGIGAHFYTSHDNKTPSIRTMLQAYGSIVLDVPYIKFGIQFCTTQFLDAFKCACA
jgi:hypothetical protein